MKLKDHILKEHRNIPIFKDGKRFLLRVVPKEHPIAKIRDCRKQFYMDVWNSWLHPVSKRYIISFEVISLRNEFDTIEEILQFAKEQGFKIKHPSKLSKTMEKLVM